MNDMRAKYARPLRERSKGEERNDDVEPCPWGCPEVFNSQELRLEHLKNHPEYGPGAFEDLSVLETRRASKVSAHLRPIDVRNDAGFERRAESPSAESMNVEPLSRSQTPTRYTTENLAQLSIKQQRQPPVSPSSLPRDPRLSPTAPSSSRKRAASDEQSPPSTGRPPPPLYDPSAPARTSHTRNTSAPLNVVHSGNKYQQPNQAERPVVHEKQGIGPQPAGSPKAGPRLVNEPGSGPISAGKAGQQNTNEPPQGKGLPQRPHGVFQIPAQAKYPDLIMQPDSRPISHDQLAAEVKGIYGGLVMVEGKCISVDSMQMSADQKFTSEHWQALVALHRTLLHEHHDFLLASQHPSANSALRKLAAKYSMPGRMWKHGIHSFLELMRRYLPESKEYMIAFILLAYQMMALLYETVPAFEQTWIECLGDLGRYRMAVEDDDYRDRETWGGVARSWYSKAADQSPEIGRLYHHLAILAGANALQKQFYYFKALVCEQPFPSARESILTLFDPLLSDNPPAFARSHPGDAKFIRLHAMLFGRAPMDSFEQVEKEYIEQLDPHIGRVTAKFNEAGVYTAVANIAGVLEYGSAEAVLFKAYQEVAGMENDSSISAEKSIRKPDGAGETRTVDLQEQNVLISTGVASSGRNTTTQPFQQACRLALDTLTVVLNRIGDKNILPHVHVFLVFVLGALALPPSATEYVLHRFPWELLAFFLNTLASSGDVDSRFQASSHFWKMETGDHRPLPEDFLIRGQIWCHGFFPDKWFDDGGDVEERMLERASTSKARAERILWIGTKIGLSGQWLHYQPAKKHFSVVRHVEGPLKA